MPMQVREARDLDSARELLVRTYGSMRLAARGDTAAQGLRLTSASLGAARLDRVSFRMSFDAEASPLGELAFGRLRAGRVRFTADHGERAYAPGEVFFTAQPERPYTAAIDDADAELAILNPALLEEVAASTPGRLRRPIRFTGYHPVSADAAKQWKTTSAYVHALSLRDASATSPLIAGAAARLLAATALVVFPNTAQLEPTIEDRHDAHPATLRRAIAYIEARCDHDISLADVARAAGVTPRAVQLAFRRNLNCTPRDYLRQVRLAEAHRQLREAIPGDGTTVTAVAAHWGFTPSRFTERYRAAYGVTPSYTLRT